MPSHIRLILKHPDGLCFKGNYCRRTLYRNAEHKFVLPKTYMTLKGLARFQYLAGLMEPGWVFLAIREPRNLSRSRSLYQQHLKRR